MSDYEFNPGEIVTAVNRSSTPVSWNFNGRSFDLKPHERKPMNLHYVLMGIRRTPVMGTYDPAYEYQHQSLIGIAEPPFVHQYPIEPIEQTDAIEAIDRSKLPEDRQQIERVRVGWDQQDRMLAARADLPHDAGFAGALPDK